MGKKVFIIAGEASGDWIGCKIIREIKNLMPDAKFTGIGGKHMESEGLKSIFPISDISLIDFMEILRQIPRLKKRIEQTAKEIIKQKPDILVTVDSKGFNFRVAAKVQELRPQTKMIHIVAPTVWAYKPERAEKISKLYDHLLTLLPFEPPYFEKEGLDTTFIGYPVIEDNLDSGDGAAFRERHDLGDKKFICMMPGSRKGELKRMLPVFKRVSKLLEQQMVIIAADNMKLALEAATLHWPIKPIIVENTEKLDCFAACDAGIIKSGTAGLEFAFLKKPYVIAYKVNPISAYMLRRMIRVSYVNLINVLLDKEVVPELLQEDCEAEYIAENLIETIKDKDEQIADCQKAIKMLYPKGDKTPSQLAAEKVLELVG